MPKQASASAAENPQRIEPALLEEAAVRGEFQRRRSRDNSRQPERSARRVLPSTIDAGFLASDTQKGPVSLRFTIESAEVLFPRLFGVE